jgi:hypothetical protein
MEEENQKLKQMVADVMDMEALQVKAMLNRGLGQNR